MIGKNNFSNDMNKYYFCNNINNYFFKNKLIILVFEKTKIKSQLYNIRNVKFIKKCSCYIFIKPDKMILRLYVLINNIQIFYFTIILLIKI